MKNILKNKRFNKTILELKKLLEQYGILPEEWALSMHISFLAFGYNLNYKRKDHLHIVLNREKIPWRLSPQDKRIFEVTPPIKSQFSKKYYEYISATGFDFDILAFSPTTCRDFFKNNATYKLKDGTSIQIMSPLGNIKMEAKFWKLYLHDAPDKLERILGYYRQILAQANKKKDIIFYTMLKKLMVKYEEPLAKKLNQEITATKKDGTITGQVGNRGRVQGRVYIIRDIDNPGHDYSYDIIVARMTSPKLTPLLMRAKGLITDEGGSLCHAVIISRELKIPCIVGTKNATKILKDGDIVEIDANNGIVKMINQ